MGWSGDLSEQEASSSLLDVTEESESSFRIVFGSGLFLSGMGWVAGGSGWGVRGEGEDASCGRRAWMTWARVHRKLGGTAGEENV